MQRLAGNFLIVGSSLFLIGAFSPVASLFYTEPDEGAEERSRTVEGRPLTAYELKRITKRYPG